MQDELLCLVATGQSRATTPRWGVPYPSMSVVATTGYFQFQTTRVLLPDLEKGLIRLSLSDRLETGSWSDAYSFYDDGTYYFAVYYRAVQSFLPPHETSTVLMSYPHQYAHTLTPLPVSRLEDFFASYWADKYPLQAMAALTRGA